ncbi:isoprenylcysteine carboxylmethyltransferase family protein [Devosia sp. 1566]|uniref:methyltransferase family protein n=1 Tax=Devosia sp. 1566 TaxID=2499144 RepID=UPI000FD7D496|nr:isoprenylcysteine carboxylmethyltransferase family protein [Devosia sp. 1566]
MNSALDLIVTVISWSVVAQHIWATRGHFVSDKMQWPAALLAALVLLTALIYTVIIWSDEQPILAKSVGLLLELAAMALFWSAIHASRYAQLRFAFDANQPRTLLQSGPYRYVRHPFYTSYIMFWAGWAIAAWSPLAIPTLVAIILMYILAARSEERHFAGTSMSSDYEAYRARAGLFWPRLSRSGDRNQQVGS